MEPHNIKERVRHLYSNTYIGEIRSKLSNDEVKSEKNLEEICEGVLYGEEYKRNDPVRSGAKKGKEPMRQDPRPRKFEQKRDFKDKREFRRERTPPRRYGEYNRLNRPRFNILSSIVEKKLDVQWPKPFRNNRKNKTSREYWKFHKSRGHSTDAASS